MQMINSWYKKVGLSNGEMLQLSLWGKKEESFVLGAGFFLRVDVLIH